MAEPVASPVSADEQLLDGADSDGFRERWDEIQQGFVDSPRDAVSAADALVGHVLDRVNALFKADRLLLERQWAEGQQPSTEDLRVALQRYRSFFHRLLSV